VASLAREDGAHFAADLNNPRGIPGPPRGSVPLNQWYPAILKRRGEGCIFAATMAVARTAARWPGDAFRSIVVLSDGQVDFCGAAPEQVVEVARQEGVSVYPVLVRNSQYLQREADLDPHAAQVGSRMREGFLSLGEATGGLSFAPEVVDLEFTRQLLARVAEHVRTGYVAAFRPEPTRGRPKSHLVEVRLRPEGLGTVTGGIRIVVH
jgi:hypothetical protein